MIYDPYTIVVVPFPFTDKPHSKKRPALVISSTEHQIQTHHITLLMITSAKNSSWFNDCVIQDLAAAGLSSPSIIRQKMFTIDTRLIIKSVGQLALSDQKSLIKHLKKHIVS